MITPAQVDKLIDSKSNVTIVDKYDDKATVKFVRRNGRIVYTECGAAFDRTDINVALD